LDLSQLFWGGLLRSTGHKEGSGEWGVGSGVRREVRGK
jgi:hypothetical protein